MPSTVRPDLPPEVERAIDAFGNRVRVAALRSLLVDGPASRTELAERLGVSRSLLQSHLGALERLDLVKTMPPREEPGRLRRSYSVVPASVQDLLGALGQALQEGEDEE